jgi:hypothetical protein
MQHTQVNNIILIYPSKPSSPSTDNHPYSGGWWGEGGSSPVNGLGAVSASCIRGLRSDDRPPDQVTTGAGAVAQAQKEKKSTHSSDQNASGVLSSTTFSSSPQKRRAVSMTHTYVRSPPPNLVLSSPPQFPPVRPPLSVKYRSPVHIYICTKGCGCHHEQITSQGGGSKYQGPRDELSMNLNGNRDYITIAVANVEFLIQTCLIGRPVL